MKSQMVSHQKYRKDKTPEETIKTIRGILSNLGIDIDIINEHSYRTNWFSVQIEIKGLPDIGANGKGTTRELALASAYAELMERLQSEQLMEPFFRMSRLHSVGEFSINYNYKRNYLDNILSLYAKTVSEDEKIILEDNLTPYFRVNSMEYELLPNDLITYVCGSNGTCAGNTPSEALGQGMAEIAERYVLKKIMYSDETLDLPTISDEVLKSLPCYSMLEAIKEKGYKVLVKDCTLKGQFPVLGLLIVNVKTASYKFSIGCDFDINICIQRCVTEMFQGYDFDLFFRKRLLSISETIARNSIRGWMLNDPQREFVNSAIDASGYLPMHIFASTGKNVELKPFTDTLNNLNVYEQFLKFYLNQGCEIYIRDYSYLGFPTFRIYIPKYSDVFYEEGENAVTSYQTIERLKQFFYQTNTPSKYDSIKKSLHMIHELSRYNMKVPNSRFHGIMFYKSEKTDWLQDSYKVYVEALLRSAKDEEIFEFLYGKQEKNLYAYLRSMCKLSSLSLESRSAFLDLLCYDADDKGEKEFPQCNIGCTNCIYVTSCAYDCWKRLFEILQKEKKSFVCSDNIQKMTRSILQM